MPTRFRLQSFNQQPSTDRLNEYQRSEGDYTSVPASGYYGEYGGFGMNSPSNAATRELSSPMNTLANEYGTTYAEGITYDPGYSIVEAENFVVGIDYMYPGDWSYGADVPVAYSDEVHPQQDIGGNPGYRYSPVATDEGGVVDWEQYSLLGKVQAVPSSTDYYTNFEGPVGTRDMGNEVGAAIISDHLDFNPDPYMVREEYIGSI